MRTTTLQISGESWYNLIINYFIYPSADAAGGALCVGVLLVWGYEGMWVVGSSRMFPLIINYASIVRTVILAIGFCDDDEPEHNKLSVNSHPDAGPSNLLYIWPNEPQRHC